MILTAVIHKEGEWYVAECLEAGTTSQGTTIEEAVGNLQEATEVYLDEFPVRERSRPILTTFEVAVDGRAAVHLGSRSHPGIWPARLRPG